MTETETIDACVLAASLKFREMKKITVSFGRGVPRKGLALRSAASDRYNDLAREIIDAIKGVEAGE